MTRAAIKTIARLLAGVLVCAQLMIAAYACPWLERSSATSADMTPLDRHAPTASALPPCHQAPATDSSPSNLCTEHCKYGQQSDRCATVDVPPALLAPLYATVGAPIAAPRPCVTAWLSALVAASPPHAIAHCVWRI
jgi:hypothetical protein